LVADQRGNRVVETHSVGMADRVKTDITIGQCGCASKVPSSLSAAAVNVATKKDSVARASTGLMSWIMRAMPEGAEGLELQCSGGRRVSCLRLRQRKRKMCPDFLVQKSMMGHTTFEAGLSDF